LSSVIVGNARITLRLPNILQERPTVQLDEHGLDLLLLIDHEHVDPLDPQWRIIPLPAPRNAVAHVEHVERLDARERRLRALAINEILLRREADFTQGGALQVVDAVGVVGEVVGEQGLREREVEVLHGVFEHVDEAVYDGLGIGIGEAEFAGLVGAADGKVAPPG
jgi:hypothetical protein